jgi:hypothetical protein
MIDHLDLPITREDITLWKIENASSHTYREIIITNNIKTITRTQLEALDNALEDWVIIVHRRFPELISVSETEFLQDGLTLYIISVAGQQIDIWNAMQVQKLYQYTALKISKRHHF